MLLGKSTLLLWRGAWKEHFDLLHDTTQSALAKEQQNHKKSNATALCLEKRVLKYQHELNSQNLQNHMAMDFEIHGFFSLAAEVFYILQNKTNILGKITGFDVFFSK